jgi:5'-nucleotidase / UDP-sugar diphosphatase
MTERLFTSILATGDVHSHLEQADRLLPALHRIRDSALIVDSGDFFEGTGFYTCGGGAVETEILKRFYDVLAPGNHGWRHHLEDEALFAKTVCANVTGENGRPLFVPLAVHRVAGRRVAVTAVIGQAAFATIPAAERAGHSVTDPRIALRRLFLRHAGDADDWVVLSHAGFAEDLVLAAHTPFADVVFSGHCHSLNFGPERVEQTVVVKGAEHAAGFAIARPAPHGGPWTAELGDFTGDAGPDDGRGEFADLLTAVDDLAAALAEPCGTVAPQFRDRTPDRREVLQAAARHLTARAAADAVVLNDTALRPAALGAVLTRADLLETSPFDNTLVWVALTADELAGLPARLEPVVGPLLVHPAHPGGPARFDRAQAAPRLKVLTTGYLAASHLAAPFKASPLTLAEIVAAVLTTKGEA